MSESRAGGQAKKCQTVLAALLRARGERPKEVMPSEARSPEGTSAPRQSDLGRGAPSGQQETSASAPANDWRPLPAPPREGEGA